MLLRFLLYFKKLNYDKLFFFSLHRQLYDQLTSLPFRIAASFYEDDHRRQALSKASQTFYFCTIIYLFALALHGITGSASQFRCRIYEVLCHWAPPDITSTINSLERFSIECRKVIGFALSTAHDWLKRFAPLFHPIRSKTKTNRDALACIFHRFVSATCNYFEFWLVHCIVCVLCDWQE